MLKHLNSFKIFENKKFDTEFINDIEDISLEFKDIGLVADVIKDVDYDRLVAGKGYSLDEVTSFKAIAIDLKDIQERFFKYKDIKETLLRIEDISAKNGYKIDIEITTDNDFQPLDEFIEIFRDEELYEISIIIY